MIYWKQIDEFNEPNWEKVGTQGAATLFWRGKKGAVFGYNSETESCSTINGCMSVTRIR